jgi:hypothetical protein
VAGKFKGASGKCVGLAEAYRQVATDLSCHFLDAGAVTSASIVDGVHLDAEQHLRLGREVARFCRDGAVGGRGVMAQARGRGYPGAAPCVAT